MPPLPSPPPPRIDAHQHFWDYTRDAADYVWMAPGDTALRRDFGPTDLAPLLAQAGYAGSVAVQARELPQETTALLALADRHPQVLGVVGWLDLCNPAIEPAVAEAARRPRLAGLRMLVHDRADPGFADSPAHVRGVAIAQRHGLAYDLLLRPPHLAAAARLADRLPQQRFVVDHLAKPRIGAAFDTAWAAGLQALARRGNVWCKLSGLATLVPAPLPPPGVFAPYLDTALEAFGPARCMVGSDWPVCTQHASYAEAIGLVAAWARTALSAAERDAVLGANAAAFYRLDTTALPPPPKDPR